MGYDKSYSALIDERLKILRERLQAYLDREKEWLEKNAVKSYTVGPRSLTRYDVSLKDLWDAIKALEKQIDELEAMKNGGARKAVGVVPRDW